MTPVDIAKLPYRPCVGLMIVNAASKIFVAQRNDRYKTAWQMPQGGVDKGEAPAEAAIRELWEETSIPADKARIEAETKDWLPYDLPHEIVPQIWNGRYRGQEQKWFLIRFSGDDSDINIDTEHPEFSRWKWTSADTLVDDIVPFKRDVYSKVLSEFEDLI